MYNLLKNNLRAPFKVAIYLLLTLSLTANFAQSAELSNTQILRNSTLESINLNSSLSRFQNVNLSDKKIKERAKELEGVFLSIMIEPMFPDGEESNLYGGKESARVFKTLMVQEYGKILANAGGIGLAPGIEKQIKR